jgi:chemotaxis receptor (MCP) glutamine deamidase CheD
MLAEKTIEEIKVGIADWKVAREPVRIITLGLGSCVGGEYLFPYKEGQR